MILVFIREGHVSTVGLAPTFQNETIFLSLAHIEITCDHMMMTWLMQMLVSQNTKLPSTTISANKRRDIGRVGLNVNVRDTPLRNVYRNIMTSLGAILKDKGTYF
jgi:hypothetical protein